MKLLFVILFFASTTQAQGFKSYISYFTTASYRNTEGDLIVKTNGDLYVAWSQFHNGTFDNTTADIAAKYSTDGGKNWVDLGIVQLNIGTQTILSVSLIRISSSVVHMYFCVKNSNTDLSIYRKVSSNDCVTWSAPVQVLQDGGYMPAVNGCVRRLASGRILYPVYFSTNVGTVPPYMVAYAWYSDDDGATWTKSTPNLTHLASIGYAEPNSVEISPGTLIMNLRNETGFQDFSTSADNGATWGTPGNSTLTSSHSPAVIRKLSTGALIAIHNPTGTGMTDVRNVLRISRSVDNGATWVKVRDLEGYTVGYNNAYPSALEYNSNLLLTYWELCAAAGKYSLKFASIPISSL